MSHCYIHDCVAIVVGGFQQSIAAADHDNPEDSLPGLKTGWCREHELQGRRNVAGKRGRYLTKAELK